MLSSVIILYLVIPSSIQSRKYLYILDLSSITSYVMTRHIITIHYINGLSRYDINHERTSEDKTKFTFLLQVEFYFRSVLINFWPLFIRNHFYLPQNVDALGLEMEL